MEKQEQDANRTSGQLTQHAMLVAWGVYAQQIGLVEAIEQVKLHQKKREHKPQTKVLEFLVAMLAGLRHLQDISRAAHPIDRDHVMAKAWGQAGWADYSGVGRTLQSLTLDEVEAVVESLNLISQPFMEQEIGQALAESGRLVYDADLTCRPVSNTSKTYPNTAFGYMGDTIGLGYQAALVSVHSPTYGRLWLANHFHPGDTVSSTQVQRMVSAAERRTGRRPRRRTEWVASRWQQAKANCAAAYEKYETSDEKLKIVRDKLHDTKIDLAEWSREVKMLEREYERTGKQPTAHCNLSKARRKLSTYQDRLPHLQKKLDVAQRRLDRCERQWGQAKAEVEHLHKHHAAMLADNQNNATPIKALFRIDSGFATRENIAWLIEMGYDIYAKARSSGVTHYLLSLLSPDTIWERVGGNASLTAWADSTANGYFIYPVDLALARYQTGDTQSHSVLIHFGDAHVVADLDGWFHQYNARQTIEAGIKEGKNVFQMHHLKVRTLAALLLQEHFACFAANFVRFAGLWLTQQPILPPHFDTSSVKKMVEVCAHTSAWVAQQDHTWLLTFTQQSRFAGYSMKFGRGAIQLPLFHESHFAHF